MSLKLYKEKRRFDKTPEPEGEAVNRKGPLEFVIHKHHATRLHYDFRLEAGGVLVSWAVPKGPSFDPAIKRLAMMVEDHPYSYRTFEGVIPKGNYGAGNVIIWDNGTYESIENSGNSEQEIIKGIAKGGLKLRMFGKKLRGSWALVKLKNAEENAWLLIKEKDEFVSEEDITQKDKSIISGLGVEELDRLKTKSEITELNKLSPKENPPNFISPMLCSLIKSPFDRKNWLFEIKWDGYRAIADKRQNAVNLYSRKNNSFNDHYPQIVKSLESLEFDGVLDGEIVVVDDNGKPDFQNLQNYRKTHKGNLVYFVFDILYLSGRNLMSLPLIKRKELLAGLIPQNLSLVRISSHIKDKGVSFFEAAKKQDLEGIIAKKADSMYQSGLRGNNWVKIKTHLRQEAIICGFTKPAGGRKYFGALILGVHKDGELKYIGHTGSGFDDLSLKQIYTKLVMLTTDKSPFTQIPKTNTPVTWVKPHLICEVSFAEWTDDGYMRQAIFEGLREDKDIKEISVEESVDALQPILKSQKNEEKEKVEGVTVSNPNKIFWPDEGYTKGDLIRYYKQVSSIILPYLKDRPESLRRYPNGVTDEGFFQKDIDFVLPDFAESIKIYSETEGGDINYLLCQNIKTLIYMVNLGCIDINPWNSRSESLGKPDYVIFDLDPLDIGFENVIDAALETKKLLESIEIEGFPKTSGATGIHVYVPLSAKYTHAQARQFAEIIVNIVASKNPDFTSVQRSPSKRAGKVYLDFLQNREGQTLAAPYCIRPMPNATVSTPLRWEEVDSRLRPENFTIRNVLQRIEKVGDLWKPVLGKGIDLKKALTKLSEFEL